MLTPEQRAFLAGSRRATLATLRARGPARLVPICFALGPDDDAGRPIVFTPLDEKPKRARDPRDLARVRDILARPAVSLLVDRWDEDWSRLAWLRLDGAGSLLEALPPDASEHAVAVGLLRARYPQYRTHTLERLPVDPDPGRAGGGLGRWPHGRGRLSRTVSSGGGSGCGCPPATASSRPTPPRSVGRSGDRPTLPRARPSRPPSAC